MVKSTWRAVALLVVAALLLAGCSSSPDTSSSNAPGPSPSSSGTSPAATSQPTGTTSHPATTTSSSKPPSTGSPTTRPSGNTTRGSLGNSSALPSGPETWFVQRDACTGATTDNPHIDHTTTATSKGDDCGSKIPLTAGSLTLTYPAMRATSEGFASGAGVEATVYLESLGVSQVDVKVTLQAGGGDVGTGTTTGATVVPAPANGFTAVKVSFTLSAAIAPGAAPTLVLDLSGEGGGVFVGTGGNHQSQFVITPK